jgi:hypothetical protein
LGNADLLPGVLVAEHFPLKGLLGKAEALVFELTCREAFLLSSFPNFRDVSFLNPVSHECQHTKTKGSGLPAVRLSVEKFFLRDEKEFKALVEAGVQAPSSVV